MTWDAKNQHAENVRGVGTGECGKAVQCSSPSWLRFWGSIMNSPSRVQGGAPAENEFHAF